MNDWPSPEASAARRFAKRRRWLAWCGLALCLVAVATALFGPAASPPSNEPAETNPPPLNTTAAPGKAPHGMAWIPGGWFWMGSEKFPDTEPVHLAYVDGFWMDKSEVTNAEFLYFVSETQYQTVAERTPNATDLPGVPADQLVAGSVVFTPPQDPVPLDNPGNWWRYVRGADWRHPEGPGSSLEGRMQHPVVHISWYDAEAYATWAKKRLPTEAEWEFAARGGLDRAEFCWGNELKPGGKWQSNIWQGEFPVTNSAADGFRRTAPVRSFPANPYGLFDMSGNVWEWCADWYQPDYYATSPRRNPKGPASSFDPHEPTIPKRVQRGGSFMCSDSYCLRYRPAGRGKGDLNSGASHIGFRCVRSK